MFLSCASPTPKILLLSSTMAASVDYFKKSHVHNFGPTSRFQQKQSKSCSNFLCKSLIIMFVLVLVPMFPSQAPAFVNQTILREFWELLHLVVIGIAVSYGLFCRKSGEIEMENQSRDCTSHAYLAGVLNVPSFFEDGFEKLCISDERMNMASRQNPSIKEGKKLRFLTVENGIKNAHDVDEVKVSQIWNSQNFQGESLTVVADGNYDIDEHKPLGLSVRSLRSRIADTEKPEFISRNESNESLKGSCGGVAKSKVRIRGPIPLNLEKKFEEVAGSPKSSPQPKSGRTDMSEEIGNFRRHCRPHSGGIFKTEHFISKLSKHPMSSGTSSVLPELSKLRTANLDSKKELKGLLDKVSTSTVATENVGVSFESKARGFSIGSSKELGIQRSSKDYFNDLRVSAMQGVLDRGKKCSYSMISDAKPSKLAKVLARGRPVRTLQSRVFASDEMKREGIYSNQTVENVGGQLDQFEAPALLKKVRGEKLKAQPVQTQKENSEMVHPVLKARFLEYQNNERQNPANRALLSEKSSESDSESENLQESSDEKETEPNQTEDTELEGSEVDMKADQFIAKFREQMRLQKIALVRNVH